MRLPKEPKLPRDRAEQAADRAEQAARQADDAADRAQDWAEKTERMFMQKMKK